MVSWDTLFMDTDMHAIYDTCNSKNRDVINPDSTVTIGDDVWVGCRCLILKGTTIGNGCVIGAGSICTGKHQYEHSIIAGDKVLKQNIIWNGNNKP